MSLWGYLQEIYGRPKKAWYEGRPSFLPKIEAELIGKDSVVIPAKLSGLSPRDCYAYPQTQWKGKSNQISRVRLKLDELELSCDVRLTCKTRDGLGLGFRFIEKSADWKKDILDFIDRARSRGYVA